MSNLSYRTEDGTQVFEFTCERHDDQVRIYIDQQPAYGDRTVNGHLDHRFTDGNRKYICFEGQIQTEADTRAVAKAWAEGTMKYIATGETF